MKLDCRKCIHAEVCPRYESTQTNCINFKYKNNFRQIPFKIGDTVWVNTYESGDKTRGIETIECEVWTIRFSDSMMNIIFSCRGWYSNDSKYRASFKMDSIGKKVFLTKEEAIANSVGKDEKHA